jgi:hypothetical protein
MIKKHTQSEIYPVLSSLAMGCRPRVIKSLAREILLGSPWYWNGKRLNIVARSVGAIVYELRTESEAKG